MTFPKPFNLEGKIALTTEAAKGLGRAFAEAMAEAGVDAVCADIYAEGLDETVKYKIRGTG